MDLNSRNVLAQPLVGSPSEIIRKPIRILLDPGHGAGSAHNRGFIGGNEGDYNWIFAQRLIAYLEEYGFKVETTRPKKTDNPSLEARGKMGKGYDLFLSNHTNAGKHNCQNIN